MKVVVLVKHVPDAASARGFKADFTSDRGAVDCVLSELDEYAVEQALRIAETNEGTEITYLTVGPDAAADALRKALSMGGDAAVHINDARIAGADALATSAILAAALGKLEWDLVITGLASTDGGVGVVPAMVAERLGIPAATLADQLTISGSSVTIRRDSDDDSRTLTTSLPCLVSVTDKTGEARYPSFKGIMAAKKKTVEQWTLADLGIEPASATSVTAATKRPARAAGIKIKDEGDGAQQLAEFLAARKFISS